MQNKQGQPKAQFKFPAGYNKMTRDMRWSAEELRIADKFGCQRMKDLYRITWGDSVDKGKMNTPDYFHWAMPILAAEETKIVVWRTMPRDHKAKWFEFADPSVYDPGVPLHKLTLDYFKNTEEMFKKHGDLNKVAIDAIHANGMEAFQWGDGLFDNFGPPSHLYAGLCPWHSQAKLQARKPGICRVDRFGQPHYGVWEYRYKEAREFTISRFLEEMGWYDFDGLLISTRTHSLPALDGEQFGYNDVIDDELKKRTGISFRDPAYWRRPDAQETRRRILGESVTLFLRDLRAVWPKGKQLYIGIPRTDYWGPPYGNVFIDWRTWLNEKLVDGLYLGEISGKALYYPAIVDSEYRNYLADEEAGVGLKPYLYALEHIYGPACQAAGAELFVNRDSPSIKMEIFGGQYQANLERGRQD